MGIPTRITRRLHSWAEYLEHPKLLAIRLQRIPKESYLEVNQPWLRKLDFRTVLDIGANVGQFAFAAHEVWPQARIYSFEPLPDCYAQLQERMRKVPGFVAFNVALGEQNEQIPFQRHSFSPASSFLKGEPALKVEFPHADRCAPISVRVSRLDDFASELTLVEPILVKIDVQGYEDRVLRGGGRTLQAAAVVLVESSFEALYDGQPLFADIHCLMVALGFRYAGQSGQVTSPRDGRPLQADSIYRK